MDDRTRTHDPRPEDLLAAYELGLLTTDERRRFEAACREDGDLLEELFDTAPFMDALRRDPARFAAAAAAATPARPSLLSRLGDLLRPRALVPAGVAIALAFLVFSGGNDLENLAVLEPLQVTTVQVRAGSPDSDTLYADALAAYQAEDWAASAATLRRALDTAPDGWARADLARIYLGSSEMLGGDAAAAESPLHAASASTLAPVRERALWQLVQVRLLRADEAAARAALEQLADSPVYGARARELLTAMDSR